MSIHIASQNQNVGINTDNPTRTLDVNGNLRVTGIPDVTGNVNYPNILSINKNNGNIDYVKPSAFMQSDINNVEVKRSIYIASAPDPTKECSCGDIKFRINDSNTAEFKLNSNSVFTSNNTSTFDLDYGIKRWTSTYYNYFNDTITFTSANYSNYQTLDPELFNSSNTVRIYTIILPKQNNLYRLTITRILNTPVAHTFSLICEKLYIETL